MAERSKSSSDRRPRAVGVLGGGLIGAGWAARFVLNGVNVRLYSPSSGAVERVQNTLEKARRIYQRLAQFPLPVEGTLTVTNSVADAVHGTELVQESAPERLDLKQQLLATASREAASDAVICSSTSGFRPSLLQAELDHPERLLVAHPFNPVYLLPLVELCAGTRTEPDAVAQAVEIYRAVGMHPLVVRKEVDGFIANRLQEAMWREALWLVHNDVATVQEVDDAVRYSFGLRRAVIGPFRIAGGASGMRRYMEQWGPMLKSPWTKLTDVPELTDGFIDKLAAQSDLQARTENLSFRELEEKRDDGLVAVLKGLRSQRYGAGQTLAQWERALRDRAPPVRNASGPVRTPTQEISCDWLDDSGHINQSRYLELCGYATEILLRYIGVDDHYLSTVGNYLPVETHLSDSRQLGPGDRVQVLTQVLAADEERLHLFHVITREGEEAPMATSEQMLVHVNTGTRCGVPAQGSVREHVLELARLHAKLPYPERVGASILPGQTAQHVDSGVHRIG